VRPLFLEFICLGYSPITPRWFIKYLEISHLHFGLKKKSIFTNFTQTKTQMIAAIFSAVASFENTRFGIRPGRHGSSYCPHGIIKLLIFFAAFYSAISAAAVASSDQNLRRSNPAVPSLLRDWNYSPHEEGPGRQELEGDISFDRKPRYVSMRHDFVNLNFHCLK